MKRIFTAFMMMLCAVCAASAANYLTFTAEEDSSTFGIMNEKNNPDVQYSLDGGETWTALAAGDTITLAHKGDKALLRGNNPEGFSKDYDHYSAFKMTGKVAASGSVMSLIDGVGVSTEIPNGVCFYSLFKACASLTQAPALPATKLAYFCYASMFSGCTSLAQAPELPATTLTSAYSCYEGMFSGCTSLAQAPALPATTLDIGCYHGMFDGCTSLTQAPELPATTLAGDCYNSMFSGCTGLTQAPELPATKLADFCYKFMFRGCTSLTQAPELPATTLSVACYAGMFEGCTSLTQAPKLSATTLAEGCCASMFSGCTSLTQAPELPATTLAEGCYDGMFEGCTSLTQAPELPATTLAEGCYSWMFRGCTSLTEAPELPAMTLEGLCYWEMFSGCTSLTQAPELPATTLVDDCYWEMFSGCTRLTEIHVSFDDWNDDYSTAAWVGNVAPTGTFICPKALAVEYGTHRIPEGWSVKYVEDLNYLTFTAEEDGSTFGIVNGRNSPNVLYSLDGGKTWTFLAEGDTVRLAHKGDKALLKGNNPQGFSRNRMEYQSSFKMTGKIAASGSVMSLIDGTGLSSEIRGVECFGRLFENCTSLTQAPELPATTLTEDCYYGMFRGCTGLTQAPELPATTLADWCYRAMFEGCTGLIQAPELPATTLVSGCYSEMFRGCTGLTQAPALPATTLAECCYSGMFRGCTGLTKAPALPATTLAEDCYGSMFSGCTSLTQAPNLLATTLANNCYYSMFSGCTSLTKAPKLLATDLPIPSGKSSCCGSMFSGCTNLSEISVAFNEWNDNTFEWVKDVAPAGTFICPEDLPVRYGMSRIPRGWAAKNIIDGDTVDVPINYNYLTFTAEEDGSTFGIDCYLLEADVQYSLDGGNTWTKLALGDTVVLSQKGDKALIRGYNEYSLGENTKDYVHFVMTGAIAASGSVMSLIDEIGLSKEIPRSSYFFQRLFINCTSLTQAPELPATTLSDACYCGMFSGCTGLTQAPELPATALASYCYWYMFSGCTGLTKAPELPATTTSVWCYDEMFSGCTNMSEIKVSFDDWSSQYPTIDWVKNVAPTGTFICPKELPLEYGVSRIPEGWTVKYPEDVSVADPALADGITVWTDGLTVYVCGAEGKVSLYDMSGRIVAVSNSADEERALSVPSKGVYVVRANGGSSVVLVR